MDMAQPWFRLYVKFATDPKMQTMSEQDQRRWIMILCLRGSDALEEILQFGGETELARNLNISPEELAKTKSALLARGLISELWDILTWDDKQYTSDSSKERVQRFRATQRSKNVTLQDRYRNVTVTKCNGVTCNDPVTAPDTETETEISTPPRARIRARENDTEDSILLQEEEPETPYESADNLAYVERQIIAPLNTALGNLFKDEEIRDFVRTYWRRVLAGECNRIRQRRLNHLTIFGQMQAWQKSGATFDDLRRHMQKHLDRISAHDYPDHPEKYVTALIGYELKNGKGPAKTSGKRFTPTIPGSIPEENHSYPEPPADLLQEWQAGLEKLRIRFAERGGLLTPEQRLAALAGLTPISRSGDGVLRIGARDRNTANFAREYYGDDLAAVFGVVTIEP